ncbi:hypothetical protein [Clostridium sp.]
MKALILYTNTGAGHVSAGKSLCHELRNLDIETIELDTLNFSGKSTSKKKEAILDYYFISHRNLLIRALIFLFIQNLVNM